MLKISKIKYVLPMIINKEFDLKKYPSISQKIRYGYEVYAFDKIDGSQIRAEWDKKLGFHKFGSRKRLLGEDQQYLYEAIELIKKIKNQLI